MAAGVDSLQCLKNLNISCNQLDSTRFIDSPVMGSCMAKVHNADIYQLHPGLQLFKSQFLAMGITQSKLTVIHSHFKAIDNMNEDTVTVSQIMKYFGFGENEFMRKALGVLAKSREGSETLNFRDFVVTIWNYCTLQEDFGLFVFGVYDFDGNEELDFDEATELMNDLYGVGKKSEDFKELTSRIDKQRKLGAQGLKEFFFREYCINHPKFLAPAVKMQQTIKDKIIGKKWWTSAMDQRQELCDFEYEPVKSISSRLKNGSYDKDLEVDNWSESSSEAAERKHKEEQEERYKHRFGIADDPAATATPTAQPDSDSEDEAEKAKKKRRKRAKKDVPVAMTSTKRRASLSSVGSSGSRDGGARGSSGALARRPSLKRNDSMGSRRSSIKSQNSFS